MQDIISMYMYILQYTTCYNLHKIRTYIYTSDQVGFLSSIVGPELQDKVEVHTSKHEYHS